MIRSRFMNHGTGEICERQVSWQDEGDSGIETPP
jgi:hypothetical protein